MKNTGKIFFESGERAGEEITLTSNANILIGRNPNICQIVFRNDQRISRVHCTIMFNPDNGKLMVTNHSEQGILVDNAQNIEKEKTVYLNSGSKMKLGHSDTVVLFTCEQMQTAPVNPPVEEKSETDGKISINTKGDNNVFNECFVDTKEKLIATLENGMALRFFTGEGLTKNQAVLSNKRMYYNHRRGLISDMSSRSSINVKDITGTTVKRSNPLFILIIAGICLLASIIIACSINSSDLSMFVNSGGIVGIGFILALVLCWIYVGKKGNYFIVQYAGGNIKLKVKTYSTQEMLNFQKKIYALQDKNTYR